MKIAQTQHLSKRLAIFFGVFVYIFSFCVLAFPQLVAAAESAQWLDMATISYNGRIFKEDNAKDGNWHFYEQDAPDGCADEIKGFNYNTAKGPFQTQNVTLYESTRAGGGSCSSGDSRSKTTINLPAQPDGYNVTFRWVDDSNIESADGTKKFSLQADGTFANINEGVCKDFIRVGGNKSDIELTIRSNTGGRLTSDNATTSLRSKYGSGTGDSGYPFYRQIEPVSGGTQVDGEDCHISNPINTTADATNAGIKGVPQTAASANEGQSCESAFSIALSWAICGALGIMDSILGFLQTQVQTMLTVKPDAYNNPQLQEVWSYFRNIASILLLVIGLVMIIGQATGRD